ncbi:MAG TPA: iron-containing redox enzyme family protein [Chitinophagales bacterium]|nr:iron-containing redox enzyme family protein [Chitinophagales bacterium]
MKTNKISEIQELLKKDPKRLELINHPVLKMFKSKQLTKKQVEGILGQWYHPLDNFPFFLSSCIAHIRITEIQTFISDILYEELGCGLPEDSHLRLYESTMADQGYDSKAVSKAKPFAATEELIEGYKRSSKKQNSALGFLYATEVADLAMVSSIGVAVGNNTNKKVAELPWVDIHVKQEPNHVNKVNSSLTVELTDEDQAEIITAAKQMWKLWIAFFEKIAEEIKLEQEVTV